MVMYQVPSSSPKSNTRTTLSCSIFASTCASRMKRPVMSMRCASASRIVLIATVRSSQRWRPRYTSPMPPCAMARSTT